MAFENLYGNIDFQAGNKMELAKQAQFADMVGRGIQASQNAQSMDLKRRQLEGKANEFNLEKAAEQAAYEIMSGGAVTPERRAKLEAFQVFQRPTYNPATEEFMGAPNILSGLGLGQTAQAPQGAVGGATMAQAGEFPAYDMINDYVEPVSNQLQPLGSGNVPYNPAQDVVSTDTDSSIMTEAQFNEAKGLNVPQIPQTGKYAKEKVSIDEANIDLQKTAAEKQMNSIFKDAELNKAAVSQQSSYEDNLSTLLSAYEDLIKSGSEIKTLGKDATMKDVIGNITSSIGSTGLGQAALGAIGTKGQAARDEVNRVLPLMFGDLRKLVGMTGKELDTKKEREFYLKALTNPNTNIESNLKTIFELSQRYGNNSAAGKVPSVVKLLGGDKDNKRSRLEELRAKAAQ